MDSIHELENELFRRWPGHDNDLFCPDGLHHTGQPLKDKEHWIVDENGKEEELWKASSIRCLFLTKDHNLQGNEEGVDVRCETGYDNTNGKVYSSFYGKYLMLLYGLMHIDTSTFDYPQLNVAKEVNNFFNYFHSAPVVRINVKKIAGGSSCSNNTLAKAMAQDIELCKKQICIYDANVIVVCNGNGWDINADHSVCNHMLDMIYQLYPDLKPWHSGCEKNNDTWIYYSEKSQVIVIHEYHMSARKSYEEYYTPTKMVADFFKAHPEYLRNNKKS